METPDFERFLSFVRLEEPDRVPLAELLADVDIKKAMLGREIETIEDDIEFHVKAGMDYVRVLADGRGFDTGKKEKSYKYSLYSEGATRGWAAEGEGLIRTRENFEGFPFPELSEIHSSTAEKLREVLDRKYPKMGMMGGFGDVFTRTWQLRGFEAFCRDLYSDRRLIKRIFRKISEISLHECKLLIEAGVDAVWPSDDIAHIDGPMVSPKDLREFFFPWLKQVGKLAKKHSLPVVYHTDGYLAQVMDDIINCHVDALHPIEPKAMDIREVKRRWGHRLALIGNIDLGYTLTLGTVEDVVREVKERIRELAPSGGYAVSTSNTVAHYVKVENYLAMINATRKLGTYPISL